jgi:hypothetical protein
VGDGQALALEIIGDGAAKPGVSDPMGAVGLDGKITAGELVRALGAGFDARELALYGKVDGLIVADLEMQARVLLERAPIAAIERVGADKIQRAGDGAAPALASTRRISSRMVSQIRLKNARVR